MPISKSASSSNIVKEKWIENKLWGRMREEQCAEKRRVGERCAKETALRVNCGDGIMVDKW